MRKTILSAIVVLSGSLALFVVEAQQPAAQSGKAAPKGSVQGRLTWFYRNGKVAGRSGEPGVYRTLTISPDGKRIAVERTDPPTPNQTQNRDIWLIEIASGKSTRFTSDPAWEAFPAWSPDGSRIIFTSNRGGNFDLYQKASNGTGPEELFYKSSDGKGVTSWSPDGRFLIYYSLGEPTHVKLLAVSGSADRAAVPVVDPRFSSITARFSPDGRWILYNSNESGKSEVSVRPFDPATGTPGAPIVLTSGGGRTPLWRGDGKEIFYLGPNGMVTAMAVNTASGFKGGTPKPLFKAPEAVSFWDVTSDGKRFLMPVPTP